MAYTCPHCGAPSISAIAKWLSGNVRFANCAACGGFSHVRSTTARQCSAAGLATGAVGVLAFALGGLHPAWLWTALGAALGVYLLAWHLVALEPDDEGGWKLGRDWLFSLLGLGLLGVWWWGRWG
ncbi:hypothetical protein [Ramlibacter sp.]|uniref:hypothetical protein n=1 Tax=Ramlibacter sp. TaxID=1917967 RepID=UPI0035B12F35